MSQVKPVDLSIIILAYKSKEHLKVLLPSVFSSEEISFDDNQLAKYLAEVIVVDNGSGDGTIEWLSQLVSQLASQPISIIANANIGFSAGNNVGIKQAKGKYILLLNPDTKLELNTLKSMLDFMELRPEVGISGCKLIKGNGKLDLACRRRFPNPLSAFKRLFLGDNTDYNYSNISADQEMEVDSVVGAFMMVRKSVLEKVGLLDEDFFMYGEDIDLCWRVKEAGYKVWYYPKVVTHHYKGESSKKVPFRGLKWFHDAMWIFYKKHYRSKYPFILNWLVFLGIYGRLLILLVFNMFKAQPRVSK